MMLNGSSMSGQFSATGSPMFAGKEKVEREKYDDGYVASSFPRRLMEILDTADYNPIISWLPNGRSFIIHHSKAFAVQVLPSHFKKQSKYSSFTRKLHRYGFSRVKRGHERGAYFHPCFIRGDYRQITQMSCQSAGKQAEERATETGDSLSRLSSYRRAAAEVRGCGDEATLTVGPSTAQDSVRFAMAERAREQGLMHIHHQLLRQDILMRQLTAHPMIPSPLTLPSMLPSPLWAEYQLRKYNEEHSATILNMLLNHQQHTR